MGGHIQMAIVGIPQALDMQAKALARIVAVAGTERSKLVPDVPTFVEQGFVEPTFALPLWVGMAAAAGTPAAALHRLGEAATTALRMPEMQRFLQGSAGARWATPRRSSGLSWSVRHRSSRTRCAPPVCSPNEHGGSDAAIERRDLADRQQPRPARAHPRPCARPARRHADRPGARLLSARVGDPRRAGYSLQQALAAAGFRVVLFDLRGYGLSSRPDFMAQPSAASRPSLACMFDALDDLGDVVDFVCRTDGVDRVDLLGYSWGTARSAGFAVAAPHRVRRLVLVAPVWRPTSGAAAEAVDPDRAGVLNPMLGGYRVFAPGDLAKQWDAEIGSLDTLKFRDSQALQAAEHALLTSDADLQGRGYRAPLGADARRPGGRPRNAAVRRRAPGLRHAAGQRGCRPSVQRIGCGRAVVRLALHPQASGDHRSRHPPAASRARTAAAARRSRRVSRCVPRRGPSQPIHFQGDNSDENLSASTPVPGWPA